MGSSQARTVNEDTSSLDGERPSPSGRAFCALSTCTGHQTDETFALREDPSATHGEDDGEKTLRASVKADISERRQWTPTSRTSRKWVSKIRSVRVMNGRVAHESWVHDCRMRREGSRLESDASRERAAICVHVGSAGVLLRLPR